MRKVVGLIAFCCMVSSTGYVSYAEAARSFNQMRMKELEKDPKIQEYLKLAEKENSSDVQEENRSEELNSEDASEDSVPQTTKKKKRKKKKRNRSVQNSANDSTMYGESDNQTISEDRNFSQTTNSKKKKKKKKNKKNRSVQNSTNDSTAYGESDYQMMNQNQNFNQTTGNKKKKKRKKKKNKKNRTNQMNQMGQMNQMDMMNQNQTGRMSQMGQMNMMNQNQINPMNQMNRMGQTNMMNQNQVSPMNQMNQMGSMNNADSEDEFALNEPIIDGTKIKKSSIIVEKDIRLASNNETKKIEKGITPINLSPLDKEKVLNHVELGKDKNLAANFDSPDLKIKEKLQQVNDNRKTYNLIRTPDKALKDSIQVNRFRAELDHYRKLYSANSKNA